MHERRQQAWYFRPDSYQSCHDEVIIGSQSIPIPLSCNQSQANRKGSQDQKDRVGHDDCLCLPSDSHVRAPWLDGLGEPREVAAREEK